MIDTQPNYKKNSFKMQNLINVYCNIIKTTIFFSAPLNLQASKCALFTNISAQSVNF